MTTETRVSAVSDTQSAIRRAISWHPQIQAAAGLINQQGALIDEAKSGYLPSVGGGLDLGVERGSSDDNGPRFNLNVSQMIYDFGKVSGRVEAESAVHDVRQAEFLATVDDVVRQTAEAIIEISRNQQLEAVAREQIRDVQSIGELVDVRTERGASTRSDRLQAEARVQAAQSTALEISGQKQKWTMTLSALVGAPVNIGRAASLPRALDRACAAGEPDWDAAPSVIAARSRQREAGARVKLASAEAFPTLALGASGRLGLLGADSDPDYVVGLTVKGDLYNGGAFRARREAAQFAAQTSAAAVGSARYTIQKSWSESVAQTASLARLQRSLASRETMMRETRDLYQKQFLDLGTRTLLDVLNADQELHAARFDDINTRYDLYKLNLECAYAAGRLRQIFSLSAEPGIAPAAKKTAVTSL